MNDTRVLSGGEMSGGVQAAGEQGIVRLNVRAVDPGSNRHSRRQGDLELDRSIGLLLHDNRPDSNQGAMRDFPQLELHEIAGAKLLVNGKIEQSEVANRMGQLEAHPDRPDVAEQRRFLAHELSIVPRNALLLVRYILGNSRCLRDTHIAPDAGPQLPRSDNDFGGPPPTRCGRTKNST